MPKITALDVLDIRFPTSRELDGSDAMNPDPDYSAAYVVLRTDDGPEGHGLAFTIGRGNDVQAAAIKAHDSAKASARGNRRACRAAGGVKLDATGKSVCFIAVAPGQRRWPQSGSPARLRPTATGWTGFRPAASP